MRGAKALHEAESIQNHIVNADNMRETLCCDVRNHSFMCNSGLTAQADTAVSGASKAERAQTCYRGHPMSAEQRPRRLGHHRPASTTIKTHWAGNDAFVITFSSICFSTLPNMAFTLICNAQQVKLNR